MSSPGSGSRQIAAKRLVSLMSRHQLAVLIALTIFISLAFTAAGLWLYNTSGTAQIDLSRPGYEGVSKELESEEKHEYVEYPATGQMNDEALREFKEAYEAQLESATTVNAFSGDPLAPESLGIDDPNDSR